jgi:hypothetical protein
MYQVGIKAICYFCNREAEIPQDMRKRFEDAPEAIKTAIPMHGLIRKDLMAGDGYQPEPPVFELPPGDEDIEDLELGENE